MKCSKAGRKNGGKMLNENQKGGMEQRRGMGVGVVGDRNEENVKFFCRDSRAPIDVSL